MVNEDICIFKDLFIYLFIYLFRSYMHECFQFVALENICGKRPCEWGTLLFEWFSVLVWVYIGVTFLRTCLL